MKIRKNFSLRNKFIIKYTKNKLVLDLGFLGEGNNIYSPLHRFLLTTSKEVFGVDCDKKRIDKLNNKKNYFFDDVVSLEKIKKSNISFDAIVAGELIEHLGHPSTFLKNLKEISNKNTHIILTTPNMFSIRYFYRFMLFQKEFWPWKNRKAEIKYGHVIGFSRVLLENLLLREGFKIIEFSYLVKNEYKGFRGNLEKVISFIFPKYSIMLGFVVKKQ